MGSRNDQDVTIFALPGVDALLAPGTYDGPVIRDTGGTGLAERLAASDASVAVARLRDLPTVAPAAEERGVAVIGLANDAEPLAALHAAGATHVVREGAAADERRQTLHSAMRYAARFPRPAAGRERREAAQGWITDRTAEGLRVGVVLALLSRLDRVNAAHGRAAGDALIAAAETRIAQIARQEGKYACAARSGQMEFVVAADASRVAAIGDAVALALSQPFDADGATIVLGCRLGVAIADPDDDAATLIRRARQALTTGRDTDASVIRHAAPAGPTAIESLARDLHRALECDEIAVLYQPQVEIAGGRIVGVEALARWDHADHGSIGADLLFAAAEAADLGVAVSHHIQRLVLAEAARWPRTLEGLRVSLNLTAADLARTDFAQSFLAMVDESGFPRGRLTIEITESGLIRDLPSVALLLAELRGAGCRVAIDDFGTGYSSLAYLKALPLDYLKIDKAMTRDIEGSARDRVIVRGVIAMARSLGFAVVAEGVETERQRALLAAEGCDVYQGYLKAEPLDTAELVAMMEGG